MNNSAELFSRVAVDVEFHPRARAVRFWREPESGEVNSTVILHEGTLTPHEVLEADIADIANKLGRAATPNFYAFCNDIEVVFKGASPIGPVAALDDIDWIKLRQLSAYAQYWQARNPTEVSKLLSFVMALPIYSFLCGQLICENKSTTLQEILHHTHDRGSTYMMGVKQFDLLFRNEINHAVNEAKLLVSTYRGTKDHNAAKIVNGMLSKMILNQGYH